MEKKLPIKYLPSAAQDITDIVEYVSIDNPPAALNLLNLLDEKISILAYFPFSGPIPNDRRLQLLNYRMLVIDSYLVFYVIHNEVIEIRRVLHAKRKLTFCSKVPSLRISPNVLVFTTPIPLDSSYLRGMDVSG